MEKQSSKSVSVMIGGVPTFFPREMIRGIIQKNIENDLRGFFFLRIHTNPFFRSVLGHTGSDAYDYQFNTVHDYCHLSGADGYIINYGTIGFHMRKSDALAFVRRFNDRPIVMVTEKVNLPNCHYIISDNRQGMFQVIEHLIKVDHCKKILFMRGPLNNTDANERYHGYLDAMASHGCRVNDSMVGLGDFSSYIDDEIERVLDANPDADAFAFSNDQMAASCYRVCEKRGLRVGVDLKITGYDSGEFAENLIPPLTSVFQDSYGMGMQASTDMAKLLNGEQLQNPRFPVTLAVRESCGCSPVQNQKDSLFTDYVTELKKSRHEAVEREQELLEYQGKSWFIPMIARDLNDCVGNETEFCYQAMEKLKLLNVNAAYLFLLDHSIGYDGKSEWQCPDNLYLAAYCRDGESFAYQLYDRPHVTPQNGIAQLTEDGKNHQFMVFLLFSGERQYGLLACDVPVGELSLFYVVSLQLGLSLQYLELNKIHEMHHRQMTQDMEVIRAKNKELDMLSCYDPLSGLLNLRGLHKSIRSFCQTKPGQKAYLIYCDLDHLKQINDNFGHPQGNFAITSCAEILRSCIRDTDQLARIGGDEFLCLVFSEVPTFAASFRARLAVACEQFNEECEKPFYVGISVGIQSFVLNTFEDFQNAVANADQLLYEAKKHRRQNVHKQVSE